MKPFLRITLYFLAANLAAIAPAKVEPANRNLLPISRQRIVDRITSPEVGAKDAIHKTDALVCITLSPGWLDILAVTPNSARAKDLAEAIDSKLSDIPGVKTEYGTSGIYGVADVTKNNSKWFQKHAELTVNAGQILQNLKSKGFSPEVVLRIPKAQGMSFEPDFETTVKSWKYRVMKDSETELVFKASSEVTPLLILGTITMCAGFLIVGAIGFVVAIIISRRKSMDIKLRRNLYYKIIMGSVFGSMIVHMPFFLWFMKAGYAKVITDSWMGSLSVSPFMVCLLIPMLFLPLAMKGITKSEKELYGTGPSDVVAKMALMEKAAKARRRQAFLFVNLPLFVVFAVVSYWAIQKGTPQLLLATIFGFAVLGIIGSSLIDSHQKKKSGSKAEPVPTDRVEVLANELANQMGVKIKKVVVNSTDLMEVCIQGTMSPTGILTLSKGAVDKLTDDELRAIIAHECGHLKMKHHRVRIAFMASGFVMIALMMAAVPLSARLLGRTSTMPSVFVIFVLTFATMPFRVKTMQKQESEADRLGLEATRNYLAIESAFQKMVANSPLPGMHDIDVKNHPAIGKRLSALREQARAMGLPTEQEIEESALPPRY